MNEEYFFKKSSRDVTVVGVLATDEYSLMEMKDQVDMTIDFNDNFLEKFFDYMEAQYGSIGCLVKIEVDEQSRGKGFGNTGMAWYQESVGNHTDVDILFARIENKQLNGFNLKKFYEKHGFEAVKYSEGNLLMINKGQAEKIREALIPSARNSLEDVGYCR